MKMMNLKNIIIKILPKIMVDFLQYQLMDGWAVKSYSQEGEDMILRRIFEAKSRGFYVDVGAHHPRRFSNTFYFYKRGWQGINIDAMPGSMRRFKEERPRDINLEIPISAENKIMTYYVFNEPALNGFDATLSKELEVKDTPYKIIKTLDLECRRLDQVLNEHLPEGQGVDFLSIDAEGLDFEVLQSNNWTKYKPEVILVEVLGSPLAEIADSDVTNYLRARGYTIYAKAIHTVIYKKGF